MFFKKIFPAIRAILGTVLFLVFSTTALSRSVINPSIHFDEGKASLRKDALPNLEFVLSVIKSNPSLYQVIVISGHTDSLESPSHADNLSRRRAKAAANYLIKNGVNPSLLKIEAWGDSHPLATNETEEGRAKNRRVDFDGRLAPKAETAPISPTP